MASWSRELKKAFQVRDIKKLRDQRDDLLAACEAYIEHMRPHMFDDEGWRLYEVLTAAIAAARPATEPIEEEK